MDGYRQGWILPNGNHTFLPNAFIDKDGVQRRGYILTQLTEDELFALGVTYFYDSIYNADYYVVESFTEHAQGHATVRDNVTGQRYTIEALKAIKVAESKTRCAATSAESDWCYIRQLRNGTPVPENIIAEGVQAYTLHASEETLINSQTDYDELLALVLGVTDE